MAVPPDARPYGAATDEGMRVLVAGADVGGTNIMVGLVDEDHEVVARRKLPTPDGARPVLDAIVGMVLDFDDKPAALGVGAVSYTHLTLPTKRIV